MDKVHKMHDLTKNNALNLKSEASEFFHFPEASIFTLVREMFADEGWCYSWPGGVDVFMDLSKESVFW